MTDPIYRSFRVLASVLTVLAGGSALAGNEDMVTTFLFTMSAVASIYSKYKESKK
jgi:hypothetical protein